MHYALGKNSYIQTAHGNCQLTLQAAYVVLQERLSGSQFGA